MNEVPYTAEDSEPGNTEYGKIITYAVVVLLLFGFVYVVVSLEAVERRELLIEDEEEVQAKILERLDTINDQFEHIEEVVG